jgi:hypothetical protein
MFRWPTLDGVNLNFTRNQAHTLAKRGKSCKWISNDEKHRNSYSTLLLQIHLSEGFVKRTEKGLEFIS